MCHFQGAVNEQCLLNADSAELVQRAHGCRNYTLLSYRVGVVSWSTEENKAMLLMK